MRLVYLAMGWTAGLLIAAGQPPLPLLWLIALAALATLAWWLQGNRWQIVILVGLAIAAGGYRYTLVPQTSDIARYNGLSVTITGTVIAEPDVRDDRVSLRVEAETIFPGDVTVSTAGQVLVNAPPTTDVRYGDTIQATGPLITPAEFDTFSYADYLARSGVFSIMEDAIVSVTDTGGGSPIMSALLNLKQQTQAHINRYLPEPEAALLTGILLGNERGIDPALDDAFSRTGASHVIAISGFNMAIISAVVMGILGRVLPGRRWLSVSIGITVLALYTLFVGANAAVVRAAVMSSLLVIAPLFRRKTYVPASLAFVAILMSFQNPLVLWDISFQLSFFAVLGLALFADPLSRYFDSLLAWLLPPGGARTISGILNEPLIVTLAAQIATTPLIILYFQRLSLVSQLVNLLIIPVQTYLLFLGILATLLAFVLPGVAQILYWMDGLLLQWTIRVVRQFARLPGADTAFAVDPRLIALFYLSITGGAIMSATRPAWAIRAAGWIRRRLIFNAVVFAGVALFALFIAVFNSRPDSRFHLWLLDAGHSNAILMQTPGGAQILVDGGRFPSRLLTAIGDRLPFYDRTLELVVITQPDDFDNSALLAVLNRYETGAVLTTGRTTLSDTQTALTDQLATAETVTVRRGYSITLDDGVTLEVLNPFEISNQLNDDTLVLRVTYGAVSFLLPGDLSRSAQAEILSSGTDPLASVLQLPQHGTARSLDEAFLAAVQPQVILLQADAANRRGDPDPDILAMLPETVPLFRTDEQGTLHLWTDGSDLWVQPER